MLQHLHIQNYALISHLDMDFGDGFTVLTGETGAGKSIILGALSLLLGGRVDTKTITEGEDKCIIEADFGEQLIRRELNRNGRSRIFVNDEVVTQAELKQIAKQLIDIHSQHESLLLSDNRFQLDIVDSLAGNEAERKAYGKAYTDYRAKETELNTLIRQAEQANKDADYIQFQYQQLQEADLRAGELEELQDEAYRLSHAESIKAALQEAGERLEDERAGAITQVRNCRLNEADKQLEERLRSVEIELKDIAHDIARLFERTEADPQRLEAVEERIDTLNRLMHKHQCQTVEELLQKRDALREQTQRIDSYESDIAELRKQLAQAKAVLEQCTLQLTQSREAVREPMCKRLTDDLGQLGVKHAHVELEINPTADWDETGRDEVQLLFAANLNQTLRRVSEVASGGEMSRLMLCIKAMVAGKNELPTLIFDEIDTGVSGEIATRMARIMREMSRRQQIIAITHLPQVAALGEHHFKVYKNDTDTRTETSISALNEEERIYEIATLLSGNEPSEAALANAKELVESQKSNNRRK